MFPVLTESLTFKWIVLHLIHPSFLYLRNIEGPFSFEFGSLLDELDRNFGCAILTKHEERLSIVGRVYSTARVSFGKPRSLPFWCLDSIESNLRRRTHFQMKFRLKCFLMMVNMAMESASSELLTKLILIVLIILTHSDFDKNFITFSMEFYH